MREQMSAFDIARMARDIAALAGARTKKMYQPHYEQVVLRLNPRGAPNRDLVIVRGRRVYFSQRDRPMPMQPPQFAMLLRKHLGNARLEDAVQIGFDRILRLVFDTKDGIRHLIIEMFRDGNVILTDAEDVIIQPLTHVKYETRTIKRGEVYVSPEAPMDPREFSEEDLQRVLSDSNRDLVHTLAGRMSLGSTYAHALCAEAGLDPAAEEVEDVSGLHAAFQRLIAEIEGEGAVAILRQATELSTNPLERDLQMQEHCLEVGPVQLTGDAIAVPFDSLSEAIDAWQGAHDASALQRREAERMAAITAPGQTDSETRKLERREAQQEAAVDKLAAKGQKAQDIGTAITEHYGHVDALLSQVLESVEHKGWDETRLAIKRIPWIESADPKARTIRAKLPDEAGEPGVTVELHLDESVHQNAQRYFAKGRKDKDRAKGAAKALEDTQTRQKRVEKRRAKDEAAGRVTVQKRSKRFWFERHRWTVLDSGQLLIGGRDAKGNDLMVKKHLKGDDLYFHADLHGAPSCVLKAKEGLEPDPHPNPLLPEGVRSYRLSQALETTGEPPLQAAAQMAVCWSRAWGGGGGAATAYHASPGQVSKTTETGESLGRGAFIVRGTRHWHKDVPVRVTLGMIAVHGVPLPLVGPHAVVSAWCDRWVRLAPGHEKKELVATRIARATGLLQDDVLSALPPGNLRIEEDHDLLSP